MAAWTGCIAGALTEPEFRQSLEAAGFEAIQIRETHRVHEHAGAAIIRARKPTAGDTCCSPEALADCCEPADKRECCGPASEEKSLSSCGCA